MTRLTLALGLTALASIGLPVDWPVSLADLGRTARTTERVDPATLTLQWQAPQGYAHPLVVGDTVFAIKSWFGIGIPSEFSAFDLQNGRVRWTYRRLILQPSPPAFSEGRLYIVGKEFDRERHVLLVLDAKTGQLLVDAEVPFATQAPTPAVVPLGGGRTRVVFTYGNFTFAYDVQFLRFTSLQVPVVRYVWDQAGSSGGSSIPSVGQGLVFLAGPGQYQAIDLATGQANDFHRGDISGGGGTTVAYDPVRRQIYVLEAYTLFVSPALTAYRVDGLSSITKVWQVSTGLGSAGGSVAIGADGRVYHTGDALFERDPSTGALLRTIPGPVARANTPILSDGVVWLMRETTVDAYSLSDFRLLRSFPGSRGSFNTAYDGPGVVANGRFLLDYGLVFRGQGFTVWGPPAGP